MPAEPQAGSRIRALVRSEHRHDEAHDAGRGIELPAVLAFGGSKLGQEVLIHTPEDVLGTVRLVADANGADEIDEFAEAMLVEGQAGS